MRTLSHVQMGPKRKAKSTIVPSENADDNDYDDSDSPFSSRPRVVDPMTTSLGREAELMPAPGPQIFEDEGPLSERRPIFVSLKLYTPGHMPSEELQDKYSEYLESCSSICLPHYLLAEQDFSTAIGESGSVLTDDQIAQLDVEEEMAAAAAAAAAEEGELSMGGAQADAQAAMAPISFVTGHLTASLQDTWAEAEAWAMLDPVQAHGGYVTTHLHQWVKSTDEALCIEPPGTQQHCYAVYCLDKPASTDLRASTRDAHLAWLCDSGRVRMAGPLLARPDQGELADVAGEQWGEKGIGPRVGTLLLVNGDDLAEVRDWATADPYNVAGLFSYVSVAPLATYGVDTVPL